MQDSYTRRDFIRLSAASVAAAGVASSACHALGNGLAGPASRPNIIYILADDLGYGDVGCFGQEKIRTPFLDQMAVEGTRYTSHYSGSAVCAPSRCSFLTGLHMGHALTRDNDGTRLDRDVTVAEVLKGAGYTTAVIGKWGNGGTGTTGAPRNQGFDYFYGYDNQTAAHRYYPEYLYRNETRVTLEGNLDGMRGEYSHDLFTEEALQFIRANRAGPFMLYLPYTIPHAEVLVPEDSLSEYRGLWPETPFEGTSSYSAQEYPRAARAGMITRMDRDVGRIRALLRELGIERNTVVFFTSDNGPCPAGGQDPNFFNSNGPLSGNKRSLYEGGVRAPTLACWPGTLAAGAVNDRPSAAWDMMATFAELAGVDAPQGHDGVSMAPELSGNPTAQQEHEALYWEYRDNTAVRMGKWKGLRTSQGGAVRLFDLSVDIGETTDVASQHPDVVQQIESLMQREHSDTPFVLDMPTSLRHAAAPQRAAGSAGRHAASYTLQGRRVLPRAGNPGRRHLLTRLLTR